MPKARTPRVGYIDVQPSGSYKMTRVGLDHVRQHAARGGNAAELARYLRITPTTVSRWLDPEDSIFKTDFADAWDEGELEFLGELRDGQKELAKVNASMAIHMGKHFLGQDDKPMEHHHLHQVVGTLPDYNMATAEWQKKFAPDSRVQLEAPKVVEADDIEEVVVEDETGGTSQGSD